MLLPSPAPDFSDPLGMLAACHQRILQNCDLLERAQEHLQNTGNDQELKSAIGKVQRYFNTAAHHHHEDEEQNLFPMLESTADLQPVLLQLRQEHQQLNQVWQTLAVDLQALQNNRNTPELAAHIDAFASAYRAHVKKENNRLLPRAAKLLSAEQQHQLGQAMALRRGVTQD